MQRANEIERRRNLRSHVAIPAVARDEQHSFSAPCTIRDATPDGCRIYCGNANVLPDRFILQPANIHRPLKATVRWRKGRWLGLQIVWDDVLIDG